MIILLFLSSGLFLGWSLGANDAANIFGTAVGSRMVKFKTAAIIGSIFVILGAVVQGAGASETLGKLGSMQSLAAAFTVALAASLTVLWMTRLKLPVSTSQAIVGSIIGWNYYTNNPTDIGVLTQIVSTWISGPILGGIFAVGLFMLLQLATKKVKLHLLYKDALLRLSLLVIGAFGAYSLGANNIANVMGVFTHAVHFNSIDFGWFVISSKQQLFFIGGIAIGIGIITYSKHVMETVGKTLMPLTPEAALIVVLSQALVLFIFSSKSLSNAFVSIGLPSIPLVPVSSSQIVIGAIIGIGLYKGGREIKFNILGSISLGWIATPIAAGILCFFMLFFVNNVFKQDVVGMEVHQVLITDNQTPKTNSSLVYDTIVLQMQTNSGQVTAEHFQAEKLPQIIESKRDIHLWYVALLFISFISIIVLVIIFSNKQKRWQSQISYLKKQHLNELNDLQNSIEESTIKDKNPDKELNIYQKEFGDREMLQFHIDEQNRRFLQLLSLDFPTMTENEKRLAALLRLKLSSKEIASILNIPTKSLEMSLNNLCEKLKVPDNIGLSDFLVKKYKL
ncbi:MAG: inorganic phosphate transporter [Bacteroidales bacterium]|nr:inorganic phosphate transporter [Bacteroidales bacterium]